MAQVKIDKDRSYRLGKGEALDAYNDRLSDEYHAIPAKPLVASALYFRPSLRCMRQLHPTKGFRSVSYVRLENPGSLEARFHGWAALAARITGSRVGGEPKYGTGRKRARLPHQGARERARRRGDLKAVRT